MYDIGDLFDKRVKVGVNLNQYISESSYTKEELCEAAGISKATLDKLLTGSYTGRAGFEKQIRKVMNCLSLTPNLLMVNDQEGSNRISVIREAVGISVEEVAKQTGLSEKRLKEIEEGGYADIGELRDIAYCLCTSVSGLLGTNFFGTQAAVLEEGFDDFGEREIKEVSGFWGHIGILPKNQENFLWFPITGAVRRGVMDALNRERIVVPCMNNKVLLVNMENIKEVILLDDACDQPGNVNWDSKVDCGEVPLVLYEAVDDYAAYCEGEEVLEDVLSSSLRNILETFCRERECEPEEMCELIRGSMVYYNDGKSRYIQIDFDYSEGLLEEIISICHFVESDVSENWLSCCDLDGAEILLNMKNVALLELPMLEVENAMCIDPEMELF